MSRAPGGGSRRVVLGGSPAGSARSERVASLGRLNPRESRCAARRVAEVPPDRRRDPPRALRGRLWAVGLRFRVTACRVTMTTWRRVGRVTSLDGADVPPAHGEPYREATMVLALVVPVLMLVLLIGMDVFEERLFGKRPPPSPPPPPPVPNPRVRQAPDPHDPHDPPAPDAPE